jgi:hypothetical protein
LYTEIFAKNVFYVNSPNFFARTIFFIVVIYNLLARWFAEPIASTLKMEAICSSETSVAIQRRHIPEDDTLQVVLEFKKP